MSSTNTAFLLKSLGFIGLGAMGKPMTINLAKSLPVGFHIHVHDVVVTVMDEIHALFPEKIIKCGSAKEVTEKSVRFYRKPRNSWRL
jgi:3-hydroxyisobutyrate dehydrogenase